MGYNHFRFAKRTSPTNVLFEPIAVTGSDLVIKPNNTDTYPFIKMNGDGTIEITSKTYVELWKQALRMYTLDYGSNVSTISGGAVAGDDLKLKCNGSDSRPFLNLAGGAGALIDVATGGLEIGVAGAVVGSVGIGGGASGGVLKLKETTTPTATTDYGAIYTKADNHLYWQSGAGVEYDLGGA